jgi:hypothetical protein
MNTNENSESPLLTYVLLLSLLVSCGSFSLFMLQQASGLNNQVIQDRRVIAEFHTVLQPKYDWFVSSLQVYAQRNPDFKPILAKYGLQAGTLEERVGMVAPK